MLETAIVAFTTFFATIGPVDVAAVFAAMTSGVASKQRRAMAYRGSAIAAGILLLFALFGEFVLTRLGITLASLRVAGGVLLLLIAIDLVFARDSGGTTTTQEEEKEGTAKADISVFPLATPLIAGPGAMGAAILLMANAEGDWRLQGAVLGAMLAVIGLTLAGLLLADQLTRLFGVTAAHVISRVFGVLLSALAVQFIFDGIANSGLLG